MYMYMYIESFNSLILRELPTIFHHTSLFIQLDDFLHFELFIMLNTLCVQYVMHRHTCTCMYIHVRMYMYIVYIHNCILHCAHSAGIVPTVQKDTVNNDSFLVVLITTNYSECHSSDYVPQSPLIINRTGTTIRTCTW